MFDEASFVFSLIGIAAVLMASNRVRFDIVALLVVLALMLSGVLSVSEALSGFGNPVVIMVAGLLVIGEMLDRTGVAAAVGDFILEKGGASETRLLVALMVGAALLGAVMSSTAVVAIFIPITLRIAAETSLNASRLLIPMSYAALISGMLTLIATPPNLVVHEELKNAGYDGFGFFSFAPVGLAVLVVAVLYMLLVGRRLLPSETAAVVNDRLGRSILDIWEEFSLEQRYESMTVTPSSPLAGMTIVEAEFESRYRIRILGIMRRRHGGEERIASPASNVEIRPADTLLVVGPEDGRKRLQTEQKLSPYTMTDKHRQRWLNRPGFSGDSFV